LFLLTAAEMAELDRRTIDVVGLPGAVLMENAGRGATRAILARFGRRPIPVAIVCGTGNNGGDGFVIARVLAGLGFRPRTALLGTRERVRGDAAIHLRALQGAGGALEEIVDVAAFESWTTSLGPCGLVIDAVFGTGLRSARGRGTGAGGDRVARSSAGSGGRGGRPLRRGREHGPRDGHGAGVRADGDLRVPEARARVAARM
jgi:hydroxyethylthiazole kinase-like uncharacterized protein yjeF